MKKKQTKHPKKFGKIIALFFVILFSFIPLTFAGLDQDPESTWSEDVLAKLGNDVKEIISVESGDHIIDAIVVCSRDSPQDIAERTEDRIETLEITQSWDGFRMFRTSVSVNDLMDLAKLSYVTRIDNNTREKVVCMDDARYYTQVQALQYYYPALDGNLAGSTTNYTTDDVVIAILDTGIDTGHYDLDGGKVIGWVDLIGDENGTKQEDPYDDHGHGTHCASIAAGSGDGSPVYKGVARYASLVGVKMIAENESTTKAIAIEALEWVEDNADTYGIEIASCSWGFTDYGDYDAVALAADELYIREKVVVVVAAGNEGVLVGAYNTTRTPGTAKRVITVGKAIDPEEGGWNISSISGRGPCDDGRNKPDILAPGENIKAAEYGTTDDYIEGSGTSMAAPFVAGVVALLLDYMPGLRYDNDSDTNPDVKQLLMGSAVDVPGDSNPGLDNSYGAGRIDALKALTFLIFDVSTWSTDAYTMLTYDDDERWKYNEPLWSLDEDYKTDWYKVTVYTDWYIYARAWADPDLTVLIRIYDDDLDLVDSSGEGSSPYVDCFATYTGVYYIRVECRDKTGDYCDVHIITTAS